jgi:hypothetical protein
MRIPSRYLSASVARTSSAEPELSVTLFGDSTFAAMAPPPPGRKSPKPPWLLPSSSFPCEESMKSWRPSSENERPAGAAMISGRTLVRTK